MKAGYDIQHYDIAKGDKTMVITFNDDFNAVHNHYVSFNKERLERCEESYRSEIVAIFHIHPKKEIVPSTQ